MREHDSSRFALLFAIAACHATSAERPSAPETKPEAQGPAEAPLAPDEPFVVAAATGCYHTCALLKDGTVRCAGNNDHGQLGLGKFDDQKHPVPTPVPGLRNATRITAGWTHTCTANQEGEVHCWGDDNATLTGGNPAGPIGWGHPRVKRIPGVDATAFNLSMSTYRTLAITPKGVVMSWGEEEEGLDLCSAGSAKACARKPVPIATDAVEVAASALTTCIRTSKGKVMCKGYDFMSSTLAHQTALAEVPGIENAMSLAMGESHACAVLRSGRVVCWGQNDKGQLGLGHVDERGTSPPSAVVQLRDAETIAIGWKRTCVQKGDGTVWCWGAGIQEDGSFSYYGEHASSAPVAVPGLSHVRSLALSVSQSCAVTGKGRMFCWGLNENGEVADGTREERALPVSVAWRPPGEPKLPVPDRSVIATDLATSDEHACAITKSGGLRCWGSNLSGQLGTGKADADAHRVPVAVAGLKSVVQIDLDSGRTCALTRDGTVRCWGDNRWGVLGDGTTAERAKPVVVAGITASHVGVGLVHGCALGTDAAVRCWGSNVHGELGVPAPVCPWQDPGGPSFGAAPDIPCLLQPGPTVSGLTNVSKIAVGSTMSCAITTGGEAWCWGENHVGQLGDGTRQRRSTPSRVSMLSDVKDIGIGYQNACALRASGAVHCWGYNGQGELGIGHVGGARPVPVPVKGISDAIALAVGGWSACAIFATGEVKCWGGVPDVGSRSGSWVKPEVVKGLPPVAKVALGSMHACALGTDGSVWCWGHGPGGLVGSSKSRVSVPTPIRWRSE